MKLTPSLSVAVMLLEMRTPRVEPSTLIEKTYGVLMNSGGNWFLVTLIVMVADVRRSN